MHKNTNLAGQPVIYQLLSFVSREIVDTCVSNHQSGPYYKTITTWKQLVFMIYGAVTKCFSLNSLYKNLIFPRRPPYLFGYWQTFSSQHTQ